VNWLEAVAIELKELVEFNELEKELLGTATELLEELWRASLMMSAAFVNVSTWILIDWISALPSRQLHKPRPVSAPREPSA
jgi:hypothetical protein